MLDMFFSSTAAVVVTAILLWVVWRWQQRQTNHPPGPTPWPIIGNMWLLRKDPIQALSDLRKQYGDVVSVYMGSDLYVFVHGLTAIKQMLVTRGEEFADRGQLFALNQVSNGKGIGSTSGNLWKEQRRFSLHTLRDFGFGKKSLEARITDEAEVIIRQLEQLEGQTFSCAKLFSTATSNVIASIVFSERFSIDRPEEVEYTAQFSKLMAAMGFASFVNVFPWLRYLPGDFFGCRSIKDSASFVRNFTRARIDEHKKTLDPGNLRDFIDAYLVEMKRMKTSSDTTFSDDQLVQVIIDLTIGGTETSSTTLCWAILFLVNHPDEQKKLRAEIHSVIGQSRLPCMADRMNMPYTVAVINEVQRLGDIGPIGPPHAPKEDTTLCGYFIPKGTPIFPMFHGLHQDSGAWENPQIFDPSRFLDADGQVISSQYLMPFSAGKRVCLGESLARMEIFLFLTTILQKFHFRLPDDVTSYREDGILGLSRAPHPFLVTSQLGI